MQAFMMQSGLFKVSWRPRLGSKAYRVKLGHHGLRATSLEFLTHLLVSGSNPRARSFKQVVYKL